MKYNLLLILILSIFILSITNISSDSSQSNLGTFKQNSCVQLYQTCDDCSYVNFTNIKYPDGTIETFNLAMTKTGQNFNYTICNSTQIGDYTYTVAGDKGGTYTTEVIGFGVTGTGYDFSLQRMLSYFFLLGILIGLFVLSLMAIPRLPSEDSYDDEGVLISINKLKYLRPVLYMVAWMLLVAVVFTGSNISTAYMGDNMFGDLLFKIFQIMFAMTLPAVVLWFIYIFYNIFQDKKMKGYLERGLEFER